MPNKTILLTGASGFLGNRVGQALVQRGDRVVALVRNPERCRGMLSFPAQLVQWDEPYDQIPDDICAQIDGVIHLAGESIAGQRWNPAYKERLYSSRVDSTAGLVRCLQRHQQCKSFIQASGIGAYGDTGEDTYEESRPFGSDFLSQLAKEWEQAAHPLESMGIRWVALRFGIILGLSGGALPELQTMYARRLGAVLGSGQQWQSWLHVDDAVAMLLQALDSELWHGPYNACTPNPVRQADMHRALCRLYGLQPLPAAPQFALRAAIGEFANVLLSSQAASSGKAEAAGFNFLYPTLSEAMTALYEPRVVKHSQIMIAEQWVPKQPEDLWPFFADAKNLERITPPWLNFKITHVSDDVIQQGTLIDYKLNLHGAPIRWRTEISNWEPTRMFVDQQLKGPYRAWHHTHEFKSLGNGTLMTDRVEYKLPVAPLSTLVAGWMVDADVAKIFGYRAEATRALFFTPAT